MKRMPQKVLQMRVGIIPIHTNRNGCQQSATSNKEHEEDQCHRDLNAFVSNELGNSRMTTCNIIIIIIVQ